MASTIRVSVSGKGRRLSRAFKKATKLVAKWHSGSLTEEKLREKLAKIRGITVKG